MSAPSTTVKIVVCVNSDVHTRKVKVAGLAALKSLVAQWFPDLTKQHAAEGGLIFDYIDEDGDEVRLDSEYEFQDLADIAAREGKPARLRVRRPGFEVPMLPPSGNTATFATFAHFASSAASFGDSTSNAPSPQQASNNVKSNGSDRGCSISSADPLAAAPGKPASSTAAAATAKHVDNTFDIIEDKPLEEMPAAAAAASVTDATSTAKKDEPKLPNPMEELCAPVALPAPAEKPAEPTKQPDGDHQHKSPVKATTTSAVLPPAAPATAASTCDPAPVSTSPSSSASASLPVATVPDAMAPAEVNPFLAPIPAQNSNNNTSAAPAAAAAAATVAERQQPVGPPSRFLSKKLRSALREALPLLESIYKLASAEEAILSIQGAAFRGAVRIQANLGTGEVNFDIVSKTFLDHAAARLEEMLTAGDAAGACRLAGDFCRIFSESHSARYNYALCLVKHNKLDAALAELMHAVSLGANAATARSDPDFAPLANNLMFRMLGASDEDVKKWTPLMEICPNMTLMKCEQLMKKHNNNLDEAANDFFTNVGSANPFLPR